MNASGTAFLPGLPVASSSWTTRNGERVRTEIRRQWAAPPPPPVARRTPPRALVLDANTIFAVGASVLGVVGGVGLLVFYEKQGLATANRENTQPCAECGGETYTICSVCGGDGKNPLARDGDSDAAAQAAIALDAKNRDLLPEDAPDDACTYCEGRGKIRCFNCNGTGIQPRFLDRLSPDDFMD